MLASWRHRWTAWRNPDGVHDEIAEEMRFHIEMKAADLERRGVPAPEALRQAHAQFGKLNRLRERGYEIRGGGLVEDLWQDLRIAVRLLRKSPARTAVLLLTLALGLGMNGAIFSVLKAVVLDPLPYPESNRLLVLHQSGKTGAGGVSYPNFLDWRKGSRSFESLSVFASTQSTLMRPLPAERVNGAIVSASLFRTLRARPLIGRDFNDRDDEPGARVAMISEGLWRRRFGADPSVLAKSCTLDGHAYRIIGVVRREDSFPIQSAAIDFWATVSVDADPQLYGGSIPESRGYPRYDGALARLKQGVTIEHARAEMHVLAAQIQRAHPRSTAMNDIKVSTALDDVIGDVRRPLYLMYGAAFCVLLVASANVTSLLLLGNVNRRREFSIRDMLGAQPSRIARQLLSEFLLLSALAGTASVFIAWSLLLLVQKLAPADLPRLGQIELDAGTVLYLFLLSLVVGVAAGLVPAHIRVLRKNGPRDMQRFGAALTIAQVTLGVVLTCCSTVMAHSFWKIITTPRGFDPQHVLTAQVSLPPALYPQQSPKVRRYYADLLSSLRSEPGVISASLSQSVPLSGDDNATTVQIQGSDTGPENSTGLRFVDPTYFRTMRFGIDRGRAFNDRDTAGHPEVVLVNAAFVRRYLAGREPLGTTIRLGWGGDKPKTIVGVVSDVRHLTLSLAPQPEAYVPYAQFPVNDMAVLIRTSGEPLAMANTLRSIAAGIDPSVPIARVQALSSFLISSSVLQQFLMALIGVFATATLLLSAIGLYALLSHTTATRMREFGIRMALGSPPAGIAGMICRQAATYIMAGLLAGLVFALPGMKLLEHWLFDTAAWDGLSFLVTATVLALVATAATWAPARRAAKIAPAECLRSTG